MAGRKRVWKTLAIAAVLGVAAVPASPAALHPPEAPAPAPEGLTAVPILLVPGWGDDAARMRGLQARLVASGWPEEAVVALSFENPVGSNRDNAREIARAAIELKTAAGAGRVDVVAHSMGGLSTRYFLQNGGESHVRRVVFLATPHEGTISAFFAWGQGAREMQPGSSFLHGLRRSEPVPQGVEALTIRTPLDFHVLPRESAMLPGLRTVTVCCPTHAGLLDDADTFELIAGFLREP